MNTVALSLLAETEGGQSLIHGWPVSCAREEREMERTGVPIVRNILLDLHHISNSACLLVDGLYPCATT